MPSSLPPLDIICAIARPKTVKKVLITAGMMGVRHLHFVRACRTEKSYLTSKWLRPEACKPLLHEGMAISRLELEPNVIVHPLFRPFVEDELALLYGSDCQKFVCDTGKAATFNHLMKPDMPFACIAIGPEADWEPFELELLHKAGFVSVSLGPWILRVEHAMTAAIAQWSMAHTGADLQACSVERNQRDLS